MIASDALAPMVAAFVDDVTVALTDAASRVRPPRTGDFRADEMGVITAGAVTDQLAVDARTAGDGVFPVFEDQRRTTFAQHQAAPVGGKGAAGGRRTAGIAGRHDAQGFPGAGHAIGLRHVRTTGDHDRRLT